jgi:hypothetical protein
LATSDNEWDVEWEDDQDEDQETSAKSIIDEAWSDGFDAGWQCGFCHGEAGQTMTDDDCEQCRERGFPEKCTCISCCLEDLSVRVQRLRDGVPVAKEEPTVDKALKAIQKAIRRAVNIIERTKDSDQPSLSQARP